MRKILFFAFFIFAFIPLYSQQTAGFTFSYEHDNKCTPSTVHFTNTSSGSPNSFLWNFGDNTNPSTATNPTHPYVTAGKFTITLIAYYNGYSDTSRQIVEVYALPAFDFTKSNDSVCPGTDITFTTSVSYPATSNAIVSYLWDFGDGGTDSVKNPTYTFLNTYNLPSNHQISLTITDTNGCVYKETKQNFVFVHPKPVADFTARQDYCYPVDSPAVASFTNTTSGSTNNSYYWTFSDGQRSSAENPVVTFNNLGNYSVYLSATSPAGCTGGISKASYIRVGTFSIKDSVSDTIVCSVPGEATFYGLNGMNTDYYWDFGDGSTGNSVSRPITHTYRAAGTYQVTVRALHYNKSCVDYDTMTIRVYEYTFPKIYVQDWDTNYCNPKDTIVFVDSTYYTSSDDLGLYSLVWNFGDGSFATGSKVSHVYPGSYGVKANYTVRLSITTAYGCKLDDTTHTYTQGIHIFPIELEGRVDKLEGCIPLEVGAWTILHATSSPINHHIWIWDYPSEPNDTLDTYYVSSGTHIYTERKQYHCHVAVVNEQGCRDTFMVSLIHPGVKTAAGFTVEPYREDCYYNLMRNNFNTYPFDSLDANGELVGDSAYTELIWVVTAEFPCKVPARISDTRDTADVFPSGTGYCSVTLIPTDHGCEGNKTTIDSAFYTCPPIAVPWAKLPPRFPPPPGPPYLTCGSDTIQFIDSSCLNTGQKWHFGDAYLLEDQSTDTNHHPRFSYFPFNSYVDSISQNKYDWLYVTFTVLNDDSVDVNSPSFNRCGYCEDTTGFEIYISSIEHNFSISENDICQGETITFYDSSISAAGFDWKLLALMPMDTAGAEYNEYSTYQKNEKGHELFEEGSTYEFKKANTYAVNVVYTDSANCVFTYYGYDTIRIHPGNIVSWQSGKNGIHGILFQDKKDTLCINSRDSLFLKDISYTPPGFDSMEITSWRWIINKDTFYTPEILFFDTVPDLHDVSLRLVNEYGCISENTIKDYIMVNEITAMFVPYQPSYCNKKEVRFINYSYVSAYEFNKNTTLLCTWDFGDGSPPYTVKGTGEVFHTYNLSYLPDTIDVTLTVSALEYNCSETYTASVIITGVIAGFTTDNQVFPCPGNGVGVQFVNTTIGNPVWFSWNFGDSLSGTANESSIKDPTHEYKRAGTYDVMLVVKNPDNCIDTLFIPEYISIEGPAGSFSYSPLDGCVEHTVAFIPSVSNTDTLIVNPDKASPIISGGIHLHDTLEFTYQVTGSYTPYFYLIKWIDNDGTLERCMIEWEGMDTIHVIELFPDFEIDSLYCPGNPVAFKNTSVSNPQGIPIDSTLWDFGNHKTGNGINGITQYDSGGFYMVDMSVYIKSCIKQTAKTIEVLHFPFLEINPDSANACYQTEVFFTADSIDDISKERIVQYKWLFYDGEVMEGNPVKKIITTDRYLPYQLELIFTPENCSKIYHDSIFILLQGNPVADFEAKPQTVGYGEEIQFIDKTIPANGQLIGWQWNFGDNTESDLQNPTHSYDTSGRIVVLLRVMDEFGCFDSTEMEVLILESLNFSNIFSPTGNDGKKYFFRPLEDKGYFKKFQMNVYNKWGNLVWSNSCTEPNCPDYSDEFWWDGTHKSGQLVSDGVYYWVVQASPASETKPFILNGSVTVLNAK
jgi:PKD repeat protein